MKRALTREEVEAIREDLELYGSSPEERALLEHVEAVDIYAAPNTHGKVVKK